MNRPRALRILPLLAVVPAILAAGACSKGPSYGSVNAIIAVVDPGLRERLEPVLREGLERTVYTTRPERTFELTFTTPQGIGDFQRWRRLVVIETLPDATLVPELTDVPEDGGAVHAVVHDRWARDQTIWVYAAPTADETVRLVKASLDSLYASIWSGFVDHQVARMWASGRDSTRYRRMLQERGFGIVLPKVYRPAPASAPDSSLVFYNDDPRRIVSLHWAPAPAALDPDSLLEIRRRWARDLFPDELLPGAPADTAAVRDSTVAPLQKSRTTLDGREAVRVQGVWESDGGLNAGVFLTYGIRCGDRLVLLDGDLYAPDREKVAYVLQLERVLGTFHCAEDR